VPSLCALGKCSTSDRACSPRWRDWVSETDSRPSSNTRSGVSNSGSHCAGTSRNTSTSRGTTRSTGTSSVGGSTGTAGTGILPDEPPIGGLIQILDDLNYHINRYLSKSHKDGPILLLAMDSEGLAMRENDPPESDSLENDWLPWNMLLVSPTLRVSFFFVHLFFSLTYKLWAYGITLRFSFDIQKYWAF